MSSAVLGSPFALAAVGDATSSWPVWAGPIGWGRHLRPVLAAIAAGLVGWRRRDVG